MIRCKRWIFLGLMTSGLLTGCARDKSSERGTGATGRSSPTSSGSAESIQPERSRDEHVTQLDVNGDGKPDVWTYTVADAGANGEERFRKVRQELDLNWDGRVDLTRSFDDVGALMREVMDLDYDGKVDATYFYEKGANTRRERDFDGDGRTDSVTFYERGVLVRKERDTNADGRVDYWEYWEAGHVDRIGEDLDGDGTVDKWTRNPNNAARD
ncbi:MULTISPECIES: hypothetical protein [Myxococcus]|uniref:hypothetical protein n=1 Tax=Myxococcus TaxID=32 RepID=UPI0013D4330A|nr:MULTISPECIES: hypothetical protein [Myxococcus]NVJ25402.1 hypothetical protein [Myxococcus sp. AM011]